MTCLPPASFLQRETHQRAPAASASLPTGVQPPRIALTERSSTWAKTGPDSPLLGGPQRRRPPPAALFPLRLNAPTPPLPAAAVAFPSRPAAVRFVCVPLSSIQVSWASETRDSPQSLLRRGPWVRRAEPSTWATTPSLAGAQSEPLPPTPASRARPLTQLPNARRGARVLLRHAAWSGAAPCWSISMRH